MLTHAFDENGKGVGLLLRRSLSFGLPLVTILAYDFLRMEGGLVKTFTLG